LEKLFVKGHIFYAKWQRRFLAKLRPELRKLLVVKTYQDMDELLVVAIEVEKVLGEIGKTPHDPLQEEKGRRISTGRDKY